MATITEMQIEKFLVELSELTKRHKIYIDSEDTMPDLYNLETQELLVNALYYDIETHRYEVQ